MSFYVLFFRQYWACWYYVVYCLVKLLAKSAPAICLCFQYFCRNFVCSAWYCATTISLSVSAFRFPFDSQRNVFSSLIIIIIIIITTCYHPGYLQSYAWNKRCFCATKCCRHSVVTICGICNVISQTECSYFYASTFRSTRAVPYMAVVCNSLLLYFPSMFLEYLLNICGMVLPAPVVTGIAFILHFISAFLLKLKL